MQNNPDSLLTNKLHINPFLPVFRVQRLTAVLFTNKHSKKVRRK